MKPKLSILLPAMLGYESVLAALDAWEAQTCRDQLEILILCPDHLGPTAAQRAARPPGQVLVQFGSVDLHQARAIGIQQASGDYVMLAEDHCLPDPEWAQAMLERLEEGDYAPGIARFLCFVRTQSRGVIRVAASSIRAARLAFSIAEAWPDQRLLLVVRSPCPARQVMTPDLQQHRHRR